MVHSIVAGMDWLILARVEWTLLAGAEWIIPFRLELNVHSVDANKKYLSSI